MTTINIKEGWMIPALAFNDANLESSTGAHRVADILAGGFEGLHKISSLEHKKVVKLKLTSLQINDLTLIGSSSNGIRFERLCRDTLDLVLPIEGFGFAETPKRTYRYQAGQDVFVGISDMQLAGFTGSNVALRFNISRLNRTICGLLGSEFRSFLPLRDQTISMQQSGIAYVELFMSVLAQVDAAGSNAKILSKIALDDSFYRLCATLLCPAIFLTEGTANGRRSYVRPEINRLCEYIMGHLTEPISLTEMESTSGLSARVLQRSFQNSFGLTPKQWVRKQRLHAARYAMMNRREPISVTGVAYDFCFASPSDFACHYLLEFGEQPSSTLGREIPIVSAKPFVNIKK